ncbi:MAG TPA: peptidylprolyl isomerase [Chthoniobacterales bacterium]|nr:peptidylprolyl isomerase [Chthoniobacterales bacterium]
MNRIYLSISAALFVFGVTATAQNTPPVVTNQIADFTVYGGTAAPPIELATAFADSDVSNVVRLGTVLGAVDVALFGPGKPITVANFLNYVNQGRYFKVDPTNGQLASSFVHRSIPGFVIQGGGYLGTVNPADPANAQATQVLHFPAIQNEPGISNTRGTIAMAKVANQPNSATSEWFINLANNGGPPSNLDTANGGYTVFGKVVNNGMAVVDAIAAVPRFDFGPPFDDIPLRNYTTPNPIRVPNLVSIPEISQVSPLTFSVMSNNPAIADATVSGTRLLVAGHQAGSALFTVTATDVDGAPVSQNFTVNVIAAPGRLVQLSTRMQVGTGDNALIGGFIMRGPSAKRLMIRGIGPSTGLAGALADPVLELYDNTGAVIASNDNWSDAGNRQDIIDTTIAPISPSESAILTTLPSDPTAVAYTAIVRGANNTTGIGLVEVYDLDSGPGSTLLNIATRGRVDIDPNALIGGFFLGGTEAKRILVRAIGPSLAAASVPNPLADPILELRDGNGALLDSNDDWGLSPDQAEIQASGAAPTDPKESAVLQILPAGPFTAIVRGVNNTTGVASVEIYQLP